MEQEERPGLHIETELSRDLGLTSALAIGVGTTIRGQRFGCRGLAIRSVIAENVGGTYDNDHHDPAF